MDELKEFWFLYDNDLYAMIDMRDWLLNHGKTEKEALHLVEIASKLGLMDRRGYLTVTYKDKYDFQYWLDTLECLGYDRVYKNRGRAIFTMAGQEIEVIKQC